MWLDKFRPLYAPEAEVGSEVETEVVSPPEVPEVPEEKPDGPGSGRSAIRKSLEKGFEDTRKAGERAEKKPREARRVAGGAEVEPPKAEVEAAEGTPPAETPPKEVVPAPEAFSKEAKAEWAKTPPAIQQAVVKREQDMAKGVQELKSKYDDIEKALSPHIDSIRRFNKTPGQAIHQLFSWFQALAANPGQAFPALAQSFNYDLTKIAEVAKAAQAGQQGQPGQEQQPEGQLPEYVQKLIHDMTAKIASLEQGVTNRIGGLESTFQQQSEAKTQEILTNWSQGKDHFQEVRGLMAQLIASGAVPLKNGQVDLDGAYETAIFAHPEVRAKVLAAQEAAKEADRKAKEEAARKAQQAAADKARKTGVAVTGGAPGAPVAPGSRPGKKGSGASVRESLMNAIAEHSN